MTIEKTLNFEIQPITKIDENSNNLASGENLGVATLTLQLPDYYDSSELKDKSNYIIHRSFQAQRANERQGNACTKTRAEVSGGGRKPWRQKGTGRARAGSNSSPLWKGGGVVFGPKPKEYKIKINKKERRLALRLLLAKKASQIIVVEKFDLECSKTKDICQIIKNLNINLSQKILVVTSGQEQFLLPATNNIKNINLSGPKQIHVKQVLNADKIVIVKDSLKIIENNLNG